MNWTTTTLGNIASIDGIIGGPFGSSLGRKDYTDFGIPVIRGTNLNFGRFIGGNFAFISASKSRQLGRSQVLPNDIVFTQRGSLGQVAIVPNEPYEHYIVSQSQMALRVDPLKACPQFVYYACTDSNFSDQIEANAIATGVPHLNLGILSRLQIPDPPIKIQSAISAILGALDRKIELNSRLVDKCKELRVLLLGEALNSGDKELVELGSITTLIARGIAPSYTENEHATTVLNQRCIRDGFASTKLARRTQSHKVQTSKILLRNDILVNSTGTGTLGRTARWTTPKKATVDSHVTIVRFDTDLVDATAVGEVLLGLESQLEDLAQGSTGQTELPRLGISSLMVPVPSRSVQNILGRKISDLENVESAHREETRLLADLRETVLPRLMSGRLRVKDAEKQVEAVV